jgi:hypothetical protein
MYYTYENTSFALSSTSILNGACAPRQHTWRRTQDLQASQQPGLDEMLTSQFTMRSMLHVAFNTSTITSQGHAHSLDQFWFVTQITYFCQMWFHRPSSLWTESAVGSSAKAFDRFFRHLIRLHQDRLQLDALGPTASQAVGQSAVNLTVSPTIF